MNQQLLYIVKNFETIGENFTIGKRNKIKLIPYNNVILNIKSFKIPSLINGIIYRFFRKSKARRSYEYAKILAQKNIGTPNPIAFYENKSAIRLLDSYYICEHLKVDYVFINLFENNVENLDSILTQFATFTFLLHENGIEFLDHSPGNTLIKEISQNNYAFYLVDLNRMNFHTEMSFKKRMKNFSRISPSESMIKIISQEYARLYQKPAEDVFALMWHYNVKFQRKTQRKKEIKKKLGFK